MGSSERLESSMAASKPTSEEKNYLEEGALDAGDAELVEQIKKKYGTPEYRPLKLKEGSVKKQEGETRIIALCVTGIILVCVWGYLVIYYGSDPDSGLTESEKEDFAGGVGGVSFWLFVILFYLLKGKIRENDDFYFFEGKRRSSFFDSSTPPEERVPKSGIVAILETMGKWLFVAAFFSFLYSFLYDPDATLPLIFFISISSCCSSLVLLLIPPLALSLPDEKINKLKNEHLRARKDVSNHEKLWEKAREHEEHNQFDAATEIWSKLGEIVELERVTRLKTECLGVVLKRRIKDLTEQGVDCTQLEEQLAMIETTLVEIK